MSSRITWSSVNKRRRTETERNYRIMRKAYLSVGREFLDRIRRYGIQVVTDGDVTAADTTPIRDAYNRITGDTAVRFARYGKAAFKNRKGIDDEDLSWEGTIRKNINRLTHTFSERLYTGAIDELRSVARTFVDDGITRGLSIEDITTNILDGFFKEWQDDSRWMARRVAQTETIRASNFGTKAGIDSMGFDYVQSWLCAMDGRERESHARAMEENQNIPKDQKFIIRGENGDWECEYPGDPSLPPEESINCRCSWTAEPVDYND